MDPQTKRTLLATLLCLAVLVGWFKVQNILNPPRPSPGGATTQATGTASSSPQPTGEHDRLAARSDATTGPGSQPTSAGARVGPVGLVAEQAPEAETVTLGDPRPDDPRSGFANPWKCAAVVSSRGAAIESLCLPGHLDKLPTKNDPERRAYPLLRAVEDSPAGERYLSFATETIRVVENEALVRLDDVNWRIVQKQADDKGEAVTLQTVVKQTAGTTETAVLEISKTYRLEKGGHGLQLMLGIKNLSDAPRKVILTQRGPIGLRSEDSRDPHRAVAAVIEEDSKQVVNGGSATHADVVKAEGAAKELPVGEGQHSLWTAVGNKYFACIVTPMPLSGSRETYADYLTKVYGRAPLADSKITDDLTFQQVYKPAAPIMPGQTLTLTIDTYCGPKSKDVFEKLPEQVRQRHYELISNPDQSWCTFGFLSSGMLWLLTHCYRAVGNYGIAIIILVVIVRVVLHPISKRGQINMMKVQKSMARLKPKIEVIQEKYKNDKARLQEEQMRVYREEGINPASQFFGCLPMVLQMPIWVALWTTLNTNVNMRHEPFFWWIRDLSAPDALIPFSGEYHIPLLGAMTGPITAFNLLPIIMTITMYAQQKLTQKLTKPATPAAPKTDKQGNPLPDQMAQQQKIMSFMMIFFGFLFYNFPSGLNLYILSSNLLGMLEQYRIKTHIRDQDLRGEFEQKKAGGSASAKTGRVRRYMDQLAKRAEQARLNQSRKSYSRSSKKHD